MQEQQIQFEVCVDNEMGLHARPAAKLAREAAKFQSSIRLELEGSSADAKSVLDILGLAAQQGRRVTVSATGPDARDAVDHLKQFFYHKETEE